MKVRFSLSGSTLWFGTMDVAPPIGSKVIIRTSGRRKGIPAGSVIEFPVSADEPPTFDFSDMEAIAYYAVNNYVVIEQGPESDE